MDELDFQPTPLHKLIVLVLDRIGREVGAIELAKVLYLVDVERKKLYGSSLTQEEYTRQNWGPLPWHFHSAIKQMDGAEVRQWTEWRPFRKNCHAIGEGVRFDFSLPASEEYIVNRVLDRVRPLRPKEIERLAYETQPMETILEDERKTGRKHLGEHIDFSLIQQDPRMAEWQMNKHLYEESPDPEYEEYHKQEKARLREIVAEG